MFTGHQLRALNDVVDQLSRSLKRGRRWHITINNPYDYNWKKIVTELTKKWNFKYVAQYTPTTDHKHVQIYMRFRNGKYLQDQQAELIGAHIELGKGNEIENYKYVTKSGGPSWMLGNPKGKLHVIKRRILKNNTIWYLKTLSDQEIEAKHTSGFFNHHNLIADNKINTIHLSALWSGMCKSKNYWIYGNSG